MIILVIFTLVAIIISIILGIVAMNNINNCKNEEEKKVVKAKWQLICGLVGGSIILLIVAISFIVLI